MNEQEYRELIRRHPEYKGLFVFVRRGKGFWARRPQWYKDPSVRTKAQKEAQLEFGELGYKAYGKKGFDRKGLPIVASEKRKMKGKKFTIPRWQRIANEIKESLKEIAIVVKE